MVIRTLVFVAAGGASGAVARYLLSNAVHALVPMRFPLATRSVVMVGFLGAFTTFSTFSLEAVTLLEHGLGAQALAYIVASVVLCIGAAWAAILLTRLVWTV